MIYLEKLGLIVLILYFNETWPKSWQGLEILVFFFGCLLFLGGKHLQIWIE